MPISTSIDDSMEVDNPEILPKLPKFDNRDEIQGELENLEQKFESVKLTHQESQNSNSGSRKYSCFVFIISSDIYTIVKLINPYLMI